MSVFTGFCRFSGNDGNAKHGRHGPNGGKFPYYWNQMTGWRGFANASGWFFAWCEKRQQELAEFSHFLTNSHVADVGFFSSGPCGRPMGCRRRENAESSLVQPPNKRTLQMEANLGNKSRASYMQNACPHDFRNGCAGPLLKPGTAKRPPLVRLLFA